MSSRTRHAAWAGARRWHSAATPWAMGLAFAVLYAVTSARQQILMADPAFYMGLARSLVEGEGYVFNGTPHTVYPPGFPAWLAPVVALFGPAPFAGQLWVALLAGAGLVSVGAYLSSRRDVPRPMLVTALVGGSAAYYALATAGIRSEMPYVLSSFLVLVAVERMDRGTRPAWTHWAGAIVLTALTVLVRTLGVTLAIALLFTAGHRWIRRREGFRTGILFPGIAGLAGLAAFAGWVGWGAAHPGGGSYFDALGMADPHQPDLGAASGAMIGWRILGSVLDQGTHAAELLTGVPWLLPLWASPLLAGAVVLILVGTVEELGRSNPLAGWYLLGYAGLLFLWPYDEGVRFLVPVLPLLLHFAWRGGRRLVDTARRAPRAAGAVLVGASVLGLFGLLLERGRVDPSSRQLPVVVAIWTILAVVGAALARGARPDDRLRGARRWLAAAWLATYAVLNLAGVIDLAAQNLRGSPGEAIRSVRPALDWIARHTPPDAVIMAQTEAAIVFHTGRTVVPLPRTANAETLSGAVLDQRPDFLFVNQPHPFAYYHPTPPERYEIMRRSLPPGTLVLVFEYEHGRIFSVAIGGAARPGGPEPSPPDDEEPTA